MRIIQLREQILDNTLLQQTDADAVLPYLEDGEEVVYSVKRGSNNNEMCLKLHRQNNFIKVTGSYFVGIDWVKENELAIQVSPKMNDGFEIDYVKMLNDALSEGDNYEHLTDLVTIHFDKPSIRVTQQKDLLSIFLITEYLNILQRIAKKGLKRVITLLKKTSKTKSKDEFL